MLWETAAVAVPLYLQAVRSHGQALYFYLAALAVDVTYTFTPLLFPVVAQALCDQVAASMGYSRLPWPFYGIPWFPLALLALGSGHALQQRQHPLARHALGLAVVLAMGCVIVAWNHPVAQAWSLALATLHGVLLVQVAPFTGLPYAAAATGLLAILALGNWMVPEMLYIGPDPLLAHWTAVGIRILAVFATIWTAAGYGWWWSWRWTSAAERGLPSRWQ